MYKYDMHVHDREGSLCASSTPEEVVKVYAEKGMNGFVTTNHFIHGNTAVDRYLPWKERMERYNEAYLRAVIKAKEYDNFSVLFGFEHAWACGREVLVYGADAEFLIDHPEIQTMPIKEFCDLFINAGFVVAAAHPFRIRAYNDESVDAALPFVNAAEVYNAHNNAEENMKAFKYATKNGFIYVSGSDTHHTHEQTIGMAGIATEKPITDNKTLVSVLKSRSYKLIIDGNIIE